MLILGWLLVGLIMGFLFHGLSDDASLSSCGPPRSPYRHTLAATTALHARPSARGWSVCQRGSKSETTLGVTRLQLESRGPSAAAAEQFKRPAGATDTRHRQRCGG